MLNYTIFSIYSFHLKKYVIGFLTHTKFRFRYCVNILISNFRNLKGVIHINIRCKIKPTAHRVSLKTCPKVNSTIRNQTIWNLNHYKNKSHESISNRIKKLNQEWDTERVLEVNAASLVIISTILGLTSRRCWFILTGAVGAFLMQHAISGWCPPLPIVRKLGIRTSEEISNDKVVLKILRGDFDKKTDDVVELYNKVIKQ
jgi:hypothetical protein